MRIQFRVSSQYFKTKRCFMKSSTFIALIGIILVSCSGSRSPETSSENAMYITDIRDSDLLREEVVRAIGSDSSGLSAMDHILRFEEGLNDIISHYQDIIPSIDKEEKTERSGIDLQYLYDDITERINDYNEDVDAMKKQKMESFNKTVTAYLKRNAAESKMMFDNNYNSFTLNNDTVSARVGIASGYIWLISEWRRVDIPAILEIMRTMREYLRK